MHFAVPSLSDLVLDLLADQKQIFVHQSHYLGLQNPHHLRIENG